MPPLIRLTCTTSLTLATVVLACCPALPVRADDCSPVKAGMLATAGTPHSATFTRMKDGKPAIGRVIQTKDARYFWVQGKWRSVPYSAEDVHEIEDHLKQSTLICTELGKDSFDGKITTVYAMHQKNEDIESDVKVWLGADNLPVKVDNTLEGGNYSAVYDFSHAEAPADSIPMGQR